MVLRSLRRNAVMESIVDEGLPRDSAEIGMWYFLTWYDRQETIVLPNVADVSAGTQYYYCHVVEGHILRNAFERPPSKNLGLIAQSADSV